MGSAFGTTGITIVATLLIALSAILIIFADSKVHEIAGFPEVDNLNLAHKDLIYAQIFAWIATALAVILVIGYGLSIKVFLRPWPHLILVLLIAGTLTGSIIYTAMALNRVNNLDDDKGASGYIYGAIISQGIALLILLIALIWGWSHTSTDPKTLVDEDDEDAYDQYGYKYNAYDTHTVTNHNNRPARAPQPTPMLRTKTTETFSTGPDRLPRSRPPAELPRI